MRQSISKNISILISSLLFSSLAAAVTFQPKPETPRNGAEFGHSIAKSGKYIIVGSDRSSEFGDGQFANTDSSNRNYDHGAIFLMTDDNSEPVKKYQFLKDTAPATASNFNYLGGIANFGENVAISDNFIAATIKHYNGYGSYGVLIIPKVNGAFLTCPSGAYVTGTKSWSQNTLNCSTLPRGNPNQITYIELPSEFSAVTRNLMLRISNYTLVASNGKRIVAYHRQYPGVWASGTRLDISVSSATKISDVALRVNYLAFGVISTTPPPQITAT